MKEERIEEEPVLGKEIFYYYNERENPFFMVTTRVDVTNLYNLANKLHESKYAITAYYFTKALNEVEAFKFFYEDNRIYKYRVVNPSFTDIREDESIGFYTCSIENNLQDFLKQYHKLKKEFLDRRHVHIDASGGVVWISCLPWFNFTSCVPPIDKSISIPQLIWDKFTFEDGKCYVNLMVMAHHGFVDGNNLGRLIKKINELIETVR